MKRVIGLDLSLTATGVADVDGGPPYLIKTKLAGHDRLGYIDSAIAGTAYSTPPRRGADLVVVEGPSYGSKGSSYHQLAGLWWMVTHTLWEAGIPYAVVAPQARAKYATGKGNAGKDAVLSAVVRRFPEVEISDNNCADAWVLMAMGCDWLGEPLTTMPATHREALAKVDWPEAARPVDPAAGMTMPCDGTCGEAAPHDAHLTDEGRTRLGITAEVLS